MKKEVDEIENNSVNSQMELQMELRRQTGNLRKSGSRHKETKDKDIKNHFAEIFYSSKDAIGYADIEGVFLDVNNAFTKLTGYTKEELLYRRKYQDITPKEYQKFEDQMVEKILRTGEPVEYEKEFIRKDSSRVPVLLTAFIVQDDDGKSEGIAAIIKDITERKRAEEALRESEKRYRDLFNNVPTGMYRTTPDGRILMANPAFIQMFGYSSFEELASHNLEEEEFLSNYPRSQFKQIIEREGEVRGLESSWKKRDGTMAFVRENARAVRGEDGAIQCYEGTVEDITERKILYERSQRQAEELVALYEDINRRNKDLETLNAITQAVHQSLDLEEVYNVALDMTVALENIDMAMIYLVDEDRKEAVLQAQRNIPEDYIRRAGRIPYPKGITWKVINSGEMMNVEDAQRNPDIGPAGRDLGHHGILGIPITLEGRTIGVIWFFSYKERKFSRHEVDFLSSIGNQVATAIAKAKLYR
ncbi:MAG TPA: PAS domain S-box protein, partial [Thermodesulfobacteriota bacterium]|nr:PAS domain S-box protein [Thermodesulfobacteriota bacterium]